MVTNRGVIVDLAELNRRFDVDQEDSDLIAAGSVWSITM
jgi:hypothetical protein